MSAKFEDLQVVCDCAVRAHGEQRYGDRPYVDHLSAVVAVLNDYDFGSDYVAAGWLHDVLEDTSVTETDIRVAFGERVAKLVEAVTGGGDRATHVSSIYGKIAAYPDAAVVKLADRIANVEACAPGDRHSLRYFRENEGFTAVIKEHVPAAMWQRYKRSLSALLTA